MEYIAFEQFKPLLAGRTIKRTIPRRRKEGSPDNPKNAFICAGT
jgi:hypothetical protein